MDKRKHADHYHVYVGMPGYLPNTMFACETLAEAGNIAYAEAQDYRDAGYHSDYDDHIGHVTGNKHEGYEVNRHQYIHEDSITFVFMSISIGYCDEEDCRCPVCHELIPTYDGVCYNDCKEDTNGNT